MKNIKFLFAVLIAAFITLGSTSVFAQEDGNRDANGYVVKGPYLTNGGGANWFFGLGGGFNTTFGKEVSPFTDFAPENRWVGEAFVGKWFTPSVGGRVGLKGGVNTFIYDSQAYTSNMYTSGDQVRFGYAHADAMWNISNALSGYKETRFWDFVPYVGAGYLGIDNGSFDGNLAANVGLYNKFRLGKVVNLYVDVSLIGTKNKLDLTDAEGVKVITDETPIYERPLYIPSATVGITFNLGKKKNFDRYSSVAPVPVVYPFTEDDYNALKNRVNKLESDNDNLRQALSECEGRPAPKPVREVVTEPGPTRLYFAKGKATLVDREVAHLYDYLDAAVANKDAARFVITGCADKATGSYNGNIKLSQKRADYVKGLLVKLGIAEENIETKVAEPGTLSEENNLNRVAEIVNTTGRVSFTD